jgi:hypothetical protein
MEVSRVYTYLKLSWGSKDANGAEERKKESNSELHGE